MGDLLMDVLARFDKHLEDSIASQERYYNALQNRKAAETPGAFRPYTIKVLCQTKGMSPQPTQIARAETAREGIGLINNLGGDDIIFSNIQFDPVSIMQQFSDPINPVAGISANQIIEIGYLAAGASITIGSASAIWAYNIPANVDSPAGALLSMVELLYTPSKRPGPVPNSAGHSGLQVGGYNDLGNKDLR